MANQEHVELLMQEVKLWNEWRRQHPEVRPDLSGANLSIADLSIVLVRTDLTGADLSGTNLNGANLSGADLSDASLSGASLNGADLSEVYLSGTDLTDANLSGASLCGASLNGADLSGIDLICVNLSRANLSGADLSGANLLRTSLLRTDLNGTNLSDADLSYANLSGANLSGANLQGARTFGTVFADLDLRTVKGLAEINHGGPSPVALYTVQLPQDGSALHFLRGAGVPDEWIDGYRVHMMHPIQYHSLFISYSSQDDTLARRLHADLQAQGVRCWFAPEDMKIGDRFHARLNEAIHLQDKLLLLVSEHALESSWVEIEVRAALEKEQRQHRDVLFPIRLDTSIVETTQAWAAMLRQSRHIGDFTHWTDPQAYQVALDRLLRDLRKADHEEQLSS